MANNLSKVKRTTQAIQNLSFDEDYLVLVNLPVEYDPAGTVVRKTTDNLATQWATKSTDSTIIYIGEATIGSVANSAVWRIQEVDTTNGTIKWADGNSSFDNNFTNRESLTYS